jgi:hypothetical protein
LAATPAEGRRVTESERIKLTIILHQFTAASRLTSMEISAMLQFMDGRGYSITAPILPTHKEIKNEQ